MDLTFTSEQEAFRREVREFLDRELPPGEAFDVEFCEDEERWRFAREFTRRLGEKGWIGLTWPRAYGGLERGPVDRLILSEELSYREAPVINSIGWGLTAGTLLLGGTEEQKRRWLPRIARMETFWCEGLSEPAAGSDLASLTTSARREGDEWVLNGQKTYTTWGTRADMLYCAARSDPASTRHHGISIFAVDLRLPGVTLSPLHNLGGGRQNHTYLDSVRVPHENLIGEEGKGWHYIINAFYGGGGMGAMHADYDRMLDRIVGYCTETKRFGEPLIRDPWIRDQLAELAIMVESLKLMTYESVSNALHGTPPPYAGALQTVVYKEVQPRFAQLCTRIAGPLGQLRSSRFAPLEGAIEAWYRQSFANHAGGTPQVKRMVLATRGLGLPR